MDLRVNNRTAIPLTEIELRTSPSSGPGGQHANRSDTRVDAVFRVFDSVVLSDAQKRRIAERLGGVVTATAQDQRSQARNREAALERLAEKLARALRVAKKRTATKPTRAARERRLAAKKQRAQVKSARRRPAGDD